MPRIPRLFAAAVIALVAASTHARTDVAPLLQHYQQAGGKDFSADRGKAFWLAEHSTEDGTRMNCTSCHGTDMNKPGKHNKSGKRIEPMASSVNRERYTDLEKVEKWFTRNCKQVLKRECTAQEKGDVLRFLSQF